MAGGLFGGVQRVGGVLGDAVTGPADPRLSADQNQAAQRQALMQAGLAGLIASNPTSGNAPNTLSVLAQSALMGQQGGAQAREQMYATTQEERIRQALQDPQVLERLSPQQQALVRMMPPMQAMQYLQEMLSQEPKVVGEGGALVDASGRPVYTNTRAVNPWENWPSEMRAAALGMGIMDPTQVTPEILPQIFAKANEYRRAGATNVNVSGPQAQTNERVIDIAAADYEAIQQGATTAVGQLNSLAVMESMLDQGMSSGRLDDITAGWRGIGAQLGIADAENLGMQELFRGISNRMALEMKEGMTGPMSDRDILFLQQQVPQLGNTPEGNRLLLEVLKRMAERKIQISQMADAYLARTGVLDHNWIRYRNEWLRANPMNFSDLRARVQDTAPWEG